MKYTCQINIGLLLAALLGGAAARAQESPFRAASKEFTDEQGQIDYVRPLLALTENKAKFDPDAYRQALATYRSFVGLMPAPKPGAPAAPAGYQLVEALPVLRARAEAATVVLVNEAHDQPAHRAYAQRLLQELRPLGYALLAAEALDPADTAFVRRGVLLGSSGFYTREPAMGRLLRGARAAGYQVFGHEIREDQEREFDDWQRRSNYRDSVQAVNILARLRAQPGAKLVALVGHDHVLEKPRDGLRRLAWYLRQLGGLDALTIDQTTDFAAAPGPTQPQLLTSDGSTPATVGDNAGYVDLQVVHPRLAPVEGRPGWLSAYGLAQPRRVGVMHKAQMYTLVLVYDAQEYKAYGRRAIPLDQCFVHYKQKRVTMYVPQRGQKISVSYYPWPNWDKLPE